MSLSLIYAEPCPLFGHHIPSIVDARQTAFKTWWGSDSQS